MRCGSTLIQYAEHILQLKVLIPKAMNGIALLIKPNSIHNTLLIFLEVIPGNCLKPILKKEEYIWCLMQVSIIYSTIKLLSQVVMNNCGLILIPETQTSFLQNIITDMV